MSEKFEIELISKRCLSLIGVADDAESALDVMDVAMREHPDGHIRIRRGSIIHSERVPRRTTQSLIAARPLPAKCPTQGYRTT
jgi:hypothetical protein